MEIGKRIAALRKKAGMSQTEFGEKTGLSRQYISEIERGVKNPSLTTVKRMAEVLSVDVSIIVSDSNQDINNDSWGVPDLDDRTVGSPYLEYVLGKERLQKLDSTWNFVDFALPVIRRQIEAMARSLENDMEGLDDEKD